MLAGNFEGLDLKERKEKSVKIGLFVIGLKGCGSHKPFQLCFHDLDCMQDRLSTMDRVSRWSQDVDIVCVLCKSKPKSRDHLFFDCIYSAHIWEFLVKGILTTACTTQWDRITSIMDKLFLHTIRFTIKEPSMQCGERGI